MREKEEFKKIVEPVMVRIKFFWAWLVCLLRLAQIVSPDRKTVQKKKRESNFQFLTNAQQTFLTQQALNLIRTGNVKSYITRDITLE